MIYIAEYGNNRIQVFKHDGTFVKVIGKEGKGNGEFFLPWDVSIDVVRRRMIVADDGNKRVQFFNLDTFQYLSQFASGFSFGVV